jgi:hypothetical protein
MTANLVIWKWHSDLADPASRRKRKVKVGQAAEAILHGAGDALTEPFPQQPLLDAIDAAFPGPEEDRPFAIERNPKHVVVNVAMASRINIISVIGPLANRMGLNASEA